MTNHNQQISDTYQVIESLAEALNAGGREEIVNEFGRSSCIISTRVVIEVLRQHRIHAMPICVRMDVSHQGGETVSFGSDCYLPFRTGLWKGSAGSHLVAIIPGQRILIDASLDQAERPDRDIYLPCPFVAQVSPDFIAAKKRPEPLSHVPTTVSFQIYPSTVTTYGRCPIPLRVLKTKDWSSQKWRHRHVKWMCDFMARPTDMEHAQLRSEWFQEEVLASTTNWPHAQKEFAA